MNEEIERALRGTPSRLAFRALGAAADADLVPYCDEQLASWPDELREAPWSWLAALESGFTKPVWPLVRSLDLSSPSVALRKAALPDPRRSEMRAVTRLELGMPSDELLEAFVETAGQWENLRSVRARLLIEDRADALARFARTEAVTRLESLVLAGVTGDRWDFEKPSFRLDRPTRLRHAGLLAPDLAHLLREGLAPGLRSAEVLVATVQEARELASCAGLASLERLGIWFRCGKNGRQPWGEPFFGNVIEEDDEASAEFFSNAELNRLRSLKVRGTSFSCGMEGLGARGVEALLPVLPRLTELTLELLPIDDKSIAGVVAAIDHERIEKLVLSNLMATDYTGDAFVAAKAFPRLRHLDLSNNRLGAEGVRRLLGAEMPVLEHLDLSGDWGSPHYGRQTVQPIGDGGALAVAAAGSRRLRTVNLSATGLGPDGLGALLPLDGLEELDVSGNPIGRLPAVSGWGSLRTVKLADCALGDAGMAALPAEASLVSISLAYNSFGSDGARALAAWPVLPQLWTLDLHDHTIGDDGLAALAASRAAQRLVELDLEQDVWNAHRRSYVTPLPTEVLARESFPALDAMFLGVVDGYHCERRSTGVRDLPADARPELVTFLDHLEDDYEAVEEDHPPRDEDFRTGRVEKWAQHVAESQDIARRMMPGDIG